MSVTFRQKILAAAIFGSVAMSGSGAARAEIIQLGFILDSSGSITNTEWNTIRTGLSTAIANLIPVGTLNTYEITVVNFSNVAQVAVAPTLITTAATRTLVANTISTIPRIGSTTNYTAAFDTMLNAITGSPNYTPARKQYINFATDGEPNPSASNGIVPRDAMIAAGFDNISIEGIGISTTAAAFLQNSICYPGPCDTTAPYNFPNQGFYIGVANAQGYADAIGNKILVVTQQNVPEPATMAVLGIGLLGLAAARRRRV